MVNKAINNFIKIKSDNDTEVIINIAHIVKIITQQEYTVLSFVNNDRIFTNSSFEEITILINKLATIV